MITTIDVVDSAVKIGLGAIISGLATHWLAKANHNKALEKERSQRRRDMLEAIAQEVATFDDLAGKFCRKIRHWLEDNQPMSEVARADLERLQAAVYESSKELTSAEAKLLLLGEVKCHELLRSYWSFLMVYSIDSVAAREVTSSEVWEYREALVQKRDEFLDEVGKAFRRLE